MTYSVTRLGAYDMMKNMMIAQCESDCGMTKDKLAYLRKC